MKNDDSIMLKLFLLCFTAPLLILSLFCLNGNNRYDTQEEMLSKCYNLFGLNDLIINKTTLSDIYNTYPTRYNEGSIEDINKGILPFHSCNIGTRNYNEIKDSIGWFILELENIQIGDKNEDVTLEFYKDTLVQIAFRCPNYTNSSRERKHLPRYIADTYGYGLKTDYKYVDSISYNSPYGSSYLEGRKYINGDINMLVTDSFWDIIIFHKPKLLELIDRIKGLSKKTDFSVSNCTSTNRYVSRGSDNDKEYWNSVQREKALKAMGMDDAAEIERQSRLKYLQGGGYSSPDGGSQVHYQGSKEQQEDLRRIELMGW